MTTSPVLSITDELLAELELHARQAVCDAITDGFPYDPRIGLTTIEENFCVAANPATILALVERVRSLAERLEKAEKDAARYQHLERQGHFRAMSIDMGGNHSWTGIGRHIGKGPTIEEAIDAAIAKEAGHE